MVKICAIAGCNTNYKARIKKKNYRHNISSVFSFPHKSKNKDLYYSWLKLTKRKDSTITKSLGICCKHFDPNFIKDGKRKTLLWKKNPIPTKCLRNDHTPDVPTKRCRKPPTERGVLPDEIDEFTLRDKVSSIDDITEDMCPRDYCFYKTKEEIMMYKLEKDLMPPQVTNCIVVDKDLHVKLFKNSVPIPLPEWFRKGGCKLSAVSSLDNLPNYLQSFGLDPETGNIPHSILDELRNIQHKKPNHGPKFSDSLIRFSFIQYYTSPQAYKLLLNEFPLPSVSLLRKLSQGGLDNMKACKSLYEQGNISKDVNLLIDEMYLQKEVQYDGGRVVGKYKNSQTSLQKLRGIYFRKYSIKL